MGMIRSHRLKHLDSSHPRIPQNWDCSIKSDKRIELGDLDDLGAENEEIDAERYVMNTFSHL